MFLLFWVVISSWVPLENILQIFFLLTCWKICQSTQSFRIWSKVTFPVLRPQKNGQPREIAENESYYGAKLKSVVSESWKITIGASFSVTTTLNNKVEIFLLSEMHSTVCLLPAYIWYIISLLDTYSLFYIEIIRLRSASIHESTEFETFIIQATKLSFQSISIPNCPNWQLLTTTKSLTQLKLPVRTLLFHS